jgi:acetone carboxylase gamma subunit
MLNFRNSGHQASHPVAFKEQANMRCKCGYSFSAAVHRNKFESFAVIDDRQYLEFLRSESKVLQARGEQATLREIARSSDYVGCLLECPECSRLLLLKPSAGSPESHRAFYTREE